VSDIKIHKKLNIEQVTNVQNGASLLTTERSTTNDDN